VNIVDIFRRAVDINERDFLQEQGVVTEMQCDLGVFNSCLFFGMLL
jgi:hypothetical protein